MADELLWNFEETRRQLGKTTWGLRWLVRLREIPVVRIGRGRGKIYFDPADVRAYIERNKIPAQNGSGK